MDPDSAQRVCTGTCAAAAPEGACVAFARNSLLKYNVKTRSSIMDGRSYLPTGTTKVSSIKWSANGKWALAVHDSGILVVESNRSWMSERVKLENGSAGLGQIEFADFVGVDHLLVVWEFGRTRLYDMNSGKSVDLSDLKRTCDGRAWQTRPGNATPPLFALLSRASAGDQLHLHFSSLAHGLPPTKLPTVDAQSLSWSPDGKWLAILDVPSASPSLYIYTPDGHRFRSHPSTKESESSLGIKTVDWSPDGRYLALAKHDGKVELLNTRTFSPLAVIEHNTTINQSSLSPSDRAPVWQESVTASNERSYSLQAQPVCPPLSKLKADSDPKDLGIAELSFSCDGQYLATRDCRMLNTIWLWNMSTLAAHAVIIQHTNVRSLQWHPTRPETLLVECAEGFAHVFDASSASPPIALPTYMRVRAPMSWMNTAAHTKPVILIAERTRFRPLFPEGHDNDEEGEHDDDDETPRPAFDDDADEDSLLDVLSGRKPLPPKTEPSYTEMVDLDAEELDELEGAALDDTFRGKRRAVEIDPLDDSDIF